MNLFAFLFCVLIVNISAKVIPHTNSYDDSMFDYVINSDYEFGDGDERENKNIQEDEPKIVDGIWKCGNCTAIDQSKMLFSEILELETNYKNGFELQVGFSISNMRCIAVGAGAIFVRRVSGACSGEDVTLSINQNGHVEVKIYQ